MRWWGRRTRTDHFGDPPLERHLSLVRDERRAMPDVADAQSVRTARIWHCKYRTLEPLSELIGLEGLIIATFPDPDLESLSTLKSLRYLRILHLPHVRHLDPLAGLDRLEVLTLETLPSWDASGKVTEVESLQPLTRLSALKHLQLFGVRTPQRSLAQLEDIPSLESVRLSKWPTAEVARFRSRTGIPDTPAPGAWFDK